MRSLAIKILSFYKGWVSPLLPRSCRFYPTCSSYARQCFEKYRFFKAIQMIATRLGRCHPFHPGGFDPVPDSQM